MLAVHRVPAPYGALETVEPAGWGSWQARLPWTATGVVGGPNGQPCAVVVLAAVEERRTCDWCVAGPWQLPCSGTE